MRDADRAFFQGKTIVITGASSGIGQDLAAYLAMARVRLVLVARRAEALGELAERCRQAGSEALVLPADVADQRRMEEVCREATAAFGLPDVVVANAGVGGLNPAARFDLDIHRKTVEINVMGLAYTLIPFVPGMVQRGSGQLVGISSMAAFRGLPKAASYSSTKAAQAVFLESLRVDLRPHGIGVTSIHPGFVATPMTSHREFTMPFTLDARSSSRHIAHAIRKRKAVYLYPWQMRWLTLFNRMLPPWLFDRLVPLVSGQKPEAGPKIY
jgi:short-subunit dehydrogenase